MTESKNSSVLAMSGGEGRVGGDDGCPGGLGDLSAAVDDDDVVAAGEGGDFLVQVVRRQADGLDGRQRVRTLGFPGEGGGLRIGVNDEDVLTSVSEAGGEVDRDGGLADTALLVGYGDDHVGSC